MNSQAPSENQKRMNALRRSVDGAMQDWTIEVDHTGTYVVASDGPNSERVFRIEDGASFENRELALGAVGFLLFLLKMYDAVVTRFVPKRPAQTQEKRAANYAAECAMKCEDRKFREYLHVCHGVDVSDSKRIVTRVRSVLGISSRTELNSDPKAAARWRQLVGDADAWGRSN
jgi:hypothetical protein